MPPLVQSIFIALTSIPLTLLAYWLVSKFGGR
jgi:hypothetical protein